MKTTPYTGIILEGGDQMANVANSGGKWITRKRRLGVHLRDKFTCAYCLKDLHGAGPGEIHLDHVKSQNCSEVPDHSCANLVTACRSCNSSKGNKKASAFATKDALARIKNWTRRSMGPYLRLAGELLTGEMAK
jgi:5-methylcytosine-specific restriction endonuclease McrA